MKNIIDRIMPFVILALVILSLSNCSNNIGLSVMYNELSREDACKLATKLINEEFDKKKGTLRENKIKEMNIPEEPFICSFGISFDVSEGQKESTRWTFKRIPPGGDWATVSFNLDGSNQEVNIGLGGY